MESRLPNKLQMKKELFHAEISKGYMIKIIIDTLCAGEIARGIFLLAKDGIKFCQSDQGNSILYNIVIPSTNIPRYKCLKEMCISVNLKHMQNVFKTVKKKDSLIMYINNDDTKKLYIKIKSAKDGNKFETTGIAYQNENDYNLTTVPDYQYGDPMIIDCASEFQKIKSLTSIGKKIKIDIQKNNYISFGSDIGSVMDKILEFGSLIEEGGVCRQCEELFEECWCECEECGEYMSDCWCECEECGEYRTECICLNRYSGEYYSNVLSKLLKLPGLCSQMSFYAPKVEHAPLMIEVNASQGGYALGKINIYIKDVDQVNYEASRKDEETIKITKKTKSS